MRRVGGLGILMLLLVACAEPTAPAPVGGPLTGSWGTLPNPGGAYTLLSMQSGAGRLAGTSQQWGIADRYVGSFPIAGAYSEADSSFILWFVHGLKPATTFVGRWSADSLVGTWTEQGNSWPLRFARAASQESGQPN